jgi:photosystem II stability/assembly factor-like uncharacterized protein
MRESITLVAVNSKERKTMRIFSMIFCLISVAVLFFGPACGAGALAAQELSPELLKSFTYRAIGPTRQSGRFVDFAVPEQEPYTFYVATASGGLWKTMNNGITFEPIFDRENVISIGDVAVATTNPKIVWVGTGEANNSRSSYWGDGVYKSIDAGKTWKNMGLRQSHHIGRVIIHPKNPDIVYVAALGHLYSENPERGLYKTMDGGKTWNKVLDVVVSGRNIGVVDVAMDPSNPEILYAATCDRLRKPWTYMLGGPGSGIYKTTDAGATWKKLAGGLPAGILGRIGIAVYAKDSKILYACIENANKPGMSEEDRWQEILAGKSSQGMVDGEVFRSDDAGESWLKVSPEKQSIGGAPGYYYGQIIIDPNNDQVVHVLSASSWGTKDGGKTWQRRPLNLGGDDHALWIDPANSLHMLLGYDHGMGITYDGGKNWYHPDQLPLAQFYAVGFDMSHPYNVAGGLQDNGSAMGPSTKRGGGPIRLEDWQQVGRGDGMYNVFDQNTNRFLYNESQFGPLQRVDLLTGEQKRIAYQNVNRDLRWNWCAPILVSPHNGDVIYHAGNVVVRSAYRGEIWEEISPDLTTNDPSKLPTGKGGDGNIQYCTITTIDESPLEAGVLWAGTDDGNVWVTRDSGKNWTKLNDRISGNPGYWVSRVSSSAVNPGAAYVSYTGYRHDDFRPFVYKTTDYGQTWTSIAGNLPEEPVNVIREDPKNPDLLFVGTDLAVYVSIDGGRTWNKLKANMPTQPVHDLQIHPRENDLIVATHGRGIFIVDIAPLRELTTQVMAKDGHLFAIESKVRWVNNRSSHSSSTNFNGQSEPNGIVLYYFLKDKIMGDVKVSIYNGNKLINELAARNEPGIQKVVWDMTVRRKRTEEEKKAIEERQRRFADSGFRGREDPDYEFTPAPWGEYRFVLQAGTQTFEGFASILRDDWYEN